MNLQTALDDLRAATEALVKAKLQVEAAEAQVKSFLQPPVDEPTPEEPRKRTAKRWTDEDKALLKRYYEDGVEYPVIARRLDRTANSIANEVSRMIQVDELEKR